MKLWRIHKKPIFYVCLMAFSICFGSVSGVRPQAKIPKVAFLSPGSKDYYAPYVNAFTSGLKEVGLTVGADLIIDYQYAEGNVDAYPQIAKAIVARNPAIIVAVSPPFIEAARRETKKIPIVMAISGDPVESGLVASFARPGGNVTGLSMRSPEVSAKRLQLIKEIFPNARRIVIFWNPTNGIDLPALRDSRAAARTLDLELHPIALSKPSELETAFKTFLTIQGDSFTLILDAFLSVNRKRFIDFAVRYRIPAVYPGAMFPLSGGLMSFNANLFDLYRRTAIFVKKILAGANPADLPIERTMHSEFIINLKAAKQIGLTIPSEMLALADQVIE